MYINPHDEQQCGARDYCGQSARRVRNPQEIDSGRRCPGVVGYDGIYANLIDRNNKVLIRQHSCPCIAHCLTETGALATCAVLGVSDFLPDWRWSPVGEWYVVKNEQSN